MKAETFDMVTTTAALSPGGETSASVSLTGRTPTGEVSSPPTTARERRLRHARSGGDTDSICGDIDLAKHHGQDTDERSLALSKGVALLEGKPQEL
jgi:hypothetical protein